VAPAPAGSRPLPAPASGYVVTDAGGLTIEHVASSPGTAQRVARLYAAAAAEVESTLGLDLPPRPHAIVAFSDDEFARRHAMETGGLAPASDSILAIALPGLDRILIRESGISEGSNASLASTLRHELAHLAIGKLEAARGARLPRWLNEGMCELAGGRRLSTEEDAALASWAKFGQMPPLASFREHFPHHGNAGGRAYTVSFAFVAWLHERSPTSRLTLALQRGQSVEDAFRQIYSLTPEDAEVEWKIDLSEDQSTGRSLLLSLNVWSVMALLAIVAGLRAYYQRFLLSRKLAREEAASEGRIRELWAHTFERMAEEPGVAVYCPECRGAFLQNDAGGIGCPACGARPLDQPSREL
jgi:hypothetical protein